MNLPNKLTIVRIILVPIILIMMLPLPFFPSESGWNLFVLSYGQLIALILYIVASITDFLDGHLARKNNLVSNFGKFLDPIADKLLVTSVLIAFVQLNKVHAVVPIVILLRDLVVNGVRLMAASSGKVVAANQVGKWKTALLMTGSIIFMLSLVCSGFNILTTWLPMIDSIAGFFTGVSVMLAIISVIQYIKNNQSFLKQ